MDHQTTLQFDERETQAERCQRILSGVVGVTTTAASLTFDDREYERATRLARGGGVVVRLPGSSGDPSARGGAVDRQGKTYTPARLATAPTRATGAAVDA